MRSNRALAPRAKQEGRASEVAVAGRRANVPRVEHSEAVESVRAYYDALGSGSGVGLRRQSAGAPASSSTRASRVDSFNLACGCSRSAQGLAGSPSSWRRSELGSSSPTSPRPCERGDQRQTGSLSHEGGAAPCRRSAPGRLWLLALCARSCDQLSSSCCAAAISAKAVSMSWSVSRLRSSARSPRRTS